MRFWIGVVDQVWKARWARLDGLSTSAAVQHGALANTSPVLESVTSMYVSVVDSRHSPSTQYFSICTSVFSTVAIVVPLIARWPGLHWCGWKESNQSSD